MELGKLGIVGASGFIGQELARQATQAGWRVVGFSRSAREPDDRVSEWREWSGAPDVEGLTAVVNLAGESVAQRWTEEKKRRFYDSRVGVTKTLVKAIEASGNGPGIFVNASAVGYYGGRGDELLDERASQGSGYLADLCAEWEAAAAPLESTGVKVARLRIGVVLGEDGQAWQQMRRVFSLGLGGRFGNGMQWMPWVHVGDLAAATLHLVVNGISGAINGVSPEPLRNGEFSKLLAKELGRPAFCHAPGWALKLALGGFAGALLEGQRVMPAALLDSGFRFRFPTLESALNELC